jgi:hypothetical protein
MDDCQCLLMFAAVCRCLLMFVAVIFFSYSLTLLYGRIAIDEDIRGN